MRDYLERLTTSQKELARLVHLNKLLNSYTRCLEENIRFRKFTLEYFNILKTDADKDRFVMLLEEFGVLDWEKYGVKGYGNKERITD